MSKATADQTEASNKQTKQLVRHPRYDSFQPSKTVDSETKLLPSSHALEIPSFSMKVRKDSFLELWGSQEEQQNTLLSGKNTSAQGHDRFIFSKGDRDNKLNQSVI